MGNGNNGTHYKYGVGCPLYEDCFNCPLDDCVWELYVKKSRQEKKCKRWMPVMQMKLAEIEVAKQEQYKRFIEVESVKQEYYRRYFETFKINGN